MGRDISIKTFAKFSIKSPGFICQELHQSSVIHYSSDLCQSLSWISAVISCSSGGLRRSPQPFGACSQLAIEPLYHTIV